MVLLWWRFELIIIIRFFFHFLVTEPVRPGLPHSDCFCSRMRTQIYFSYALKSILTFAIAHRTIWVFFGYITWNTSTQLNLQPDFFIPGTTISKTAAKSESGRKWALWGGLTQMLGPAYLQERALSARSCRLFKDAYACSREIYSQTCNQVRHRLGRRQNVWLWKWKHVWKAFNHAHPTIVSPAFLCFPSALTSQIPTISSHPQGPSYRTVCSGTLPPRNGICRLTVSASLGYVVMWPDLDTSAVSTAMRSPYLPPCTHADVVGETMVFGSVMWARPEKNATNLWTP